MDNDIKQRQKKIKYSIFVNHNLKTLMEVFLILQKKLYVTDDSMPLVHQRLEYLSYISYLEIMVKVVFRSVRWKGICEERR